MSQHSKKISKPWVLIVSTGRTGTRFLGDNLSYAISDSFSIHEPDVFWGFGDPQLRNKIRAFGLFHMFPGKLLGISGIRNLARRWAKGQLSRPEVVSSMTAQREVFLGSIPRGLVIESNYQWYPLLNLLPDAFERYRVVALVRDPRDWISSIASFETLYGKRDWISRLGLPRISAEDIPGDPYADRWKNMSSFERLCWNWRYTYQCISEALQRDENVRLYRYEDVFLHREPAVLADMINFMTQFPDRIFQADSQKLDLDTPVHQSDRHYPDWREWSGEQARALQEICGACMARFGYGNEPEWLALIGQQAVGRDC